MRSPVVVAFVALGLSLAAACGQGSDDGSPGSSPPSGATPPASGGTGDSGVSAACVDAVLGAACTPGASAPCAQPANACEAGYILGCDPSTSVWYQERIQCYTGKDESTPTTSECPADQVLFVDDVAGDPCELPTAAADGSDAGTCPEGTSDELETGCCSGATDAYCVAKPSSCGSDLSCGCAASICASSCGGGPDNPGIQCASAVDSIVDCFCGKS